jgi:hypothetical protein
MLFNRDYSFRGTHADKVIELTATFDDKGNKLFIRNLDVYLLAPIVGFLYGRKSNLDSSGKNPIFCSMRCPRKLLLFGLITGSLCYLIRIMRMILTSV